MVDDVHESGLFGKQMFSIKGQANLDELENQQTYRFVGRWTEYTNKRTGITERQFHFQTFVQAAPHGRAGIVTYLRKAGEGNGIGNARANQLWEKFGPEAVRILRESPEVAAAAIKGLDKEKAISASLWLKERQLLENCWIGLSDLLNGRGFPRAIIRKIIQKWGNKGERIIRRDPYRLMNFRGCGFKRCDALFLELGHNPAKLRRQAFSVWYSMASNNDGHTWFSTDYVVKALTAQVGISGVRPAAAIQLAKRIGRLSLDRPGAVSVSREENGAIVESGGKVWLAEGRKAWNEDRIAKLVRNQIEYHERLSGMNGESFWPDACQIPGIDRHQSETLEQALRGPIAILGGSPGTGKTFCAAAIVKCLARTVGLDNIIIGAPTGKAAVRVTEALNSYGLPLKAKTWHSLLGVGKSDSESGTWGFRHNEENPWQAKLVIGDEMSMMDTDLMCSVFRAIPIGCRFLMVGDINQLPPVGHGAPLRDLIGAGIPCGQLTEIKRNSGGIVEACAAIRDSQPWLGGSDWDNLRHFEQRVPEKQLELMVESVREAKRQGLDPVWDCQVLVAVNDKSPLARKAVNKLLQGELNPQPIVKGCVFRLNDKVINLKNGYFKSYFNGMQDSINESIRTDEGEVYVANGEQGRVVSIEDRSMIVALTSPTRQIFVPLGKVEESSDDDSTSEKTGTGSSFDLAYAISVHKSQGSEWPWVVVLLDNYPGARMICSREWIYTAISRAKQQCHLIGQASVARSMCGRTAIDKRKTFLRELVQLRQVENQLVHL